MSKVGHGTVSGSARQPQLGAGQSIAQRFEYILPADEVDQAAAFEFIKHIRTNLGEQHRGVVPLEIGKNLLEREDTGRIDERHVPQTQYERCRAPLNVLQTSRELLRGSEEEWTFNTVDHDASGAGAHDGLEFG